MISYKKAADTLGVSEAVIKAVAEVESAGSGFITIKDQGFNRLAPAILFERHIFRRLLLQNNLPVDNLPPDICNQKAGGYLGGAKEYDRLDKAVKIHRDCALQSCSWGAFQIMGFHWKLLGYSSLQSFVNEMYKSEQAQLEAFVRFIKANPNLVKALQSLDWKSFAKGYNGVNYAINKYDLKLAQAYKKHSNKT